MTLTERLDSRLVWPKPSRECSASMPNIDRVGVWRPSEKTTSTSVESRILGARPNRAIASVPPGIEPHFMGDRTGPLTLRPAIRQENQWDARHQCKLGMMSEYVSISDNARDGRQNTTFPVSSQPCFLSFSRVSRGLDPEHRELNHPRIVSQYRPIWHDLFAAFPSRYSLQGTSVENRK